jgi:periplasmic mercuric ion binding protein
MNKYIPFLTAILLFAGMIMTGNNLQAQNQVEESTVKVLGNCGMCKERIEKAATGVRGVQKASWDKDTKILTVAFRKDRTSMESIERAIAKAGHDTENFSTDEKTYSDLHSCCLYKRDPSKNNKVWNQE